MVINSPSETCGDIRKFTVINLVEAEESIKCYEHNYKYSVPSRRKARERPETGSSNNPKPVVSIGIKQYSFL